MISPLPLSFVDGFLDLSDGCEQRIIHSAVINKPMSLSYIALELLAPLGNSLYHAAEALSQPVCESLLCVRDKRSEPLNANSSGLSLKHNIPYRKNPLLQRL